MNKKSRVRRYVLSRSWYWLSVRDPWPRELARCTSTVRSTTTQPQPSRAVPGKCMVPGSLKSARNRQGRLFNRHDDVGLRRTHRRRRSDQARRDPSCASHRSEGRRRSMEHDWLPQLSGPTNNNFGFQFTGKVNLLTGNGQPAPFDPTPPQSMLTVCVTGVTGEAGAVTFSNITLVLGAPANNHFGVGTVIHGVVTNPQPLAAGWWRDRR